MALARMAVQLAAMVLLAQPALAQEQQPAPTQQDLEFAKEAAEGGLKEVQFGRLAQQHARSPQVANFGRRMVQDHGKANARLKEIAEQKGIELPQELPEDVQQQYEELQTLAGESSAEAGQEAGPAQFDQMYMQEMVKDHQEDIAAFEKEAQSGEHKELKTFAEETLPTLREHLELAQQVQSEVGGDGG
jgi:putative membrane protein